MLRGKNEYKREFKFYFSDVKGVMDDDKGMET